MEDNFDLLPSDDSDFFDNLEQVEETVCYEINPVIDIDEMESLVNDDNSFWGRVKSFFGFSKK